MATQPRYTIKACRDPGFGHVFLWLVLDTGSPVPPERSIASCSSKSDARLIANALNAFIKPRFISQAPMAKAIQ